MNDEARLAPWHVAFLPDSEPQILDGRKQPVATVHGDESLAIGRALLMARAPALLKAVRAMITVLEAMREYGTERERGVATADANRGDSAQNSRPGRPCDPTSRRSKAERVGLPEATVRDAERHVETAEVYPFMQRPVWAQAGVLTAGRSSSACPKKNGNPPPASSTSQASRRGLRCPSSRTWSKWNPRDRSLAKRRRRNCHRCPTLPFHDVLDILRRHIARWPADHGRQRYTT